jgi:hypothetical protein
VPKPEPSGAKKAGLWRNPKLVLTAAGLASLIVISGLSFLPTWKTKDSAMSQDGGRFPIQLQLRSKLSGPINNSGENVEIAYRKAQGSNIKNAGWMAEVEIATEDGQMDIFTVIPRKKEPGSIRIPSQTGIFSMSNWNEWVTAGFDINAVKGKGILRFALIDDNQYLTGKDAGEARRISNWLEIPFAF